jgi:hypothetical protein
MQRCQNADSGLAEVDYLGHIVSDEGVCADPGKIKAMVDWPLPSNIKSLRGFLGPTGYYRKFIIGSGSIAAPLTAMLKKNSYSWSDSAKAAFNASFEDCSNSGTCLGLVKLF